MASTKQYLYSQKLKDVNWQKVKNRIQIRDEFTCQKCKTKDGQMQVHHRHYLKGRDPWDYPEQLLILLCQKCHKEEEDCSDILKELVPSLHYWGYFNTDIRDVANKLIQDRIETQKNG